MREFGCSRIRLHRYPQNFGSRLCLTRAGCYHIPAASRIGMNGTLQNRVLETIARHAMIRPGDRIGVGVSGGADSVSLLRLVEELRTKLGVAIFVLHFNHQLRGAEAD